jgi:DNA repair protein RecN (Recombination protein N)
MLTRIKIQNFALVEDVDLSFDKGMTVLTGETGAGKSVIVTALALVLGERADRDHIRHGASKATVEATFKVDLLPREYKTEFKDYLVDNAFTVTRQVLRDGESKCKINGAAATVTRLRELTQPVAEIMGQHSNQMLLDEENHLLFLDRFASLESDREEVGILFTRWERAYSELKKVRSKRDDLAQERELLLFQRREIENAQVRVGEEDDLNNERRVLDSSRNLMEAAQQVEQMLDDEQAGVLENLRQVRKQLDKMAEIDPKLKPQQEQLAEFDYQLEDFRRFIEEYGSSVPDDPHRLEEINVRLDELYQLKQKYGGSEESVLATLEDINARLADRPDIDAHLQELEAAHEKARTAYNEKALELTAIRKKAAAYIEKLVTKELAELAIEDALFRCEFLYEDHGAGVELDGRKVKPYAHGLEKLSFQFSANPGEPLKSLVKTASGGEVSRVFLALKAAEKKNNNLAQSLLVFDEVDAGIGGRTANEVGRKLKKLSESAQVLVITHLHQIARLADHHFLAEKTTMAGKRVVINVTPLDRDAVNAEIDRMVALPEDVKQTS